MCLQKSRDAMASKLDAERMAVIGGDTQADGTPLIRRTLDIIVKADTQGSAEAVAEALDGLVFQVPVTPIPPHVCSFGDDRSIRLVCKHN